MPTDSTFKLLDLIERNAKLLCALITYGVLDKETLLNLSIEELGDLGEIRLILIQMYKTENK